MKPSRPLVLAVTLALSGTGCGPSSLADPGDEPTTATAEDAIIGGTLAQGDPAVVAMTIRYGSGYESLCTGTLIAPRTVLTAAHCIYAYGTNASYYVTFGTYSASPTKAVAVSSQYKHPNYTGAGYDFGLLKLATPVAGVTPIPLNETPMNQAHVGRSIRHVGYGLTVAGGSSSGVKREVTYTLRSVQTLTIESGATGKQTCQGDSGGPAFMIMPGQTTESVVGVVSNGDPQCATEGFDGRVDVGLSWIRQTMAGWEAPTCATDGACVLGCTPIDQDCVCVADGQCSAECLDAALDPDCPKDCAANSICATETCGRPDPDCVPEGGLCSAATQCLGRLCMNDPQNVQNYCTHGCQQNSDCPSTMECVVGICQFKQLPVRQLLDACSVGVDYCAQSICTGPSGGITRCVQSCIVTADCPSGSACEAGANSQRYCRPPGVSFSPVQVAAVPRALGAPASGCSTSGAGLALWLLGIPLLRRRRAQR